MTEITVLLDNVDSVSKESVKQQHQSQIGVSDQIAYKILLEAIPNVSFIKELSDVAIRKQISTQHIDDYNTDNLIFNCIAECTYTDMYGDSISEKLVCKIRSNSDSYEKLTVSITSA